MAAMATTSVAASEVAESGVEVAVPLLKKESSTFSFQQVFTHENPGEIGSFYDMGKELGQGGFGTVHLATCKQTKAERAVKAISLTRLKDPAKFQREIDIAKQLDHPNVVRLFETFKDAMKLYLVMEICTGGELFDKIVDDAPKGFGERQAAVYIRQMYAGLCYLHSQNFAHRDVKPENFLLQSRAPDAVLKLIDFGLSCQFELGKPMSTKAGTAYYIAPEVLSGAYDEKCDVWSAGVICFVLVTGSPPFFGNTDAEVLAKVKKGLYRYPKKVPKDAEDLIALTLTMNPVERPSAAEVLKNAWLGEQGAPVETPIDPAFVSRLKGFQAHFRLKKVALAVVAQQLPDDRVENLQNTFRSLYKDGDGTLSAEEIRVGLEREGLELPADLQEILKTVDFNGSGKLDYTEFVAATLDFKIYSQQDIMWAAFRRFDLDGDGKITREELRTVLNNDSVVKAISMEKIEQMIKDVDLNGDGCIDFEEFCSMMEEPALKRRRLVGKQSMD